MTVTEGLVAGFTAKIPKAASASADAMSAVIHAFGYPVVDVKPVLKALPKLFEHANTAVRTSAKGD